VRVHPSGPPDGGPCHVHEGEPGGATMADERRRVSSLHTVGTFVAGRACSDTLFHVLARAFGRPMADEERAAMPLAGGILQHGYQCGMIWGAALAAGAEAHRLLGPGPRAEARAIVAARRVLEAFRDQNHATDCFDITETDRSSSSLQLFTYFFLKGGSVGCIRMAARYAPVAFREIGSALAAEDVEAPAGPVSCAAELARRMGASDLHAAMVAGFAGGIGLSGGACGALAAAIWLVGLGALRSGASRIDYKAPAALEVVERFLRCTGHELECSKIVGRTFEGVGDHARHVCERGCSKLLEALAAR
jgi:hypothetical protein